MFAARTDWPLTPNRLTQQIEERRRQNLVLLDLTESNPTHCGFSADEEILRSLQDSRSLYYEPDPRGPLRAREAVSEYYAERRARVLPEQIFLTTSTSEAYSYVFRLLADPGDKVLIPRPSYPLFDFLAGLNDLETVPYPLYYDRGWHLDLDRVREGLGPRSRAVVAVHPNNPTGSFVKADESSSLLDACRERATALIVDEVFADYVLEPDARRVPAFSASPEVLTFTLSGLSKISALPQMKLGWLVVSGPEAIVGLALKRLEVIADTYLSLSAPLGHALPALLERRKTVQPKIVERLRSNLRFLDEAVRACPAVNRLEIEGGWYTILKAPSMRSDEEWALQLLSEDGVLVHPGHFYDFPGESYLVISLLTGPAIFQEGVASLLARVSKTR